MYNSVRVYRKIRLCPLLLIYTINSQVRRLSSDLSFNLLYFFARGIQCRDKRFIKRNCRLGQLCFTGIAT